MHVDFWLTLRLLAIDIRLSFLATLAVSHSSCRTVDFVAQHHRSYGLEKLDFAQRIESRRVMVIIFRR
jgi:hypothetical protein